MTDNEEERRVFIVRHHKLDNLITYLLQSDEGLKLAESAQRDKEDRERGE